MSNDKRNPNDKTRKLWGNCLGLWNSSFFRHSSLVIRILTGVLLTISAASPCHAQAHAEHPAPLDPAQAEREARELAAAMLAQRPAQDATNVGLLKIRGADDQEREIKVVFSTRTTSTNWANIYTTLPPSFTPAARTNISCPPTEVQPPPTMLLKSSLVPN